MTPTTDEPTYGTGQLYKKHGAYYGRWRTSDGRKLNRRIGAVRPPGTEGSRPALRRSAVSGVCRKRKSRRPGGPWRRRGSPSTEASTRYAGSSRWRGHASPTWRDCARCSGSRSLRGSGERPSSKVKTADVEALASAMLASGLKPKTVHNVLVFLHGVFEHAIDRGWTHENPVRRAASRSGDGRGTRTQISSS